MYSNKGQKLLTSAVITTAALIILILILKPVMFNTQESLEVRKCRGETEKHAAQKMWSGRTFASEIQCPTRQVTIQTSNNVKEKLAEEMRKCWYSFSEGDENLFQEEATYCHTCSIISFEGREKEITGLYKYMAENEIPRKEMTYLEYLSGYSTVGSSTLESLNKQIQKLDEASNVKNWGLNTDKDYATLFVYSKGRDEIQQFLDQISGNTKTGKLGNAIGIGAGVLAGGKTAFIGYSLGIVTAGWAVGATGITAAGITWVGVQAGLFKISSETTPEHVSQTILAEYNNETLQNLDCEREPIPIKT